MKIGMYKDFSIFITTRDRLKELQYTIETLHPYLEKGVNLLICDDGSKDGTYEFLKSNYSSIQIIRNETSRGLIYSRNKLLSQIQTKYGISLDDDLNFLTSDPFPFLYNHFEQEISCAVASFRIFWSLNRPESFLSYDKVHRVKSYAGGAHAIRMQAWNDIPDYPEWFVFYGEEDYASYHLLKKGWEVHYIPEVLTHHRVDNKKRKSDKDYTQRLRRNLRSGWFLYFIFFPWDIVTQKLSYSLWMQFRKVGQGNFAAGKATVLALFDTIMAIKRLKKNRFPLTPTEYDLLLSLPAVKLYWKPETNKK
ncbi:glycosyltransferase family 2 protein [Salinimicrobium catena]|uniref:glycosyltransferase family 2 protein n=1 Tax=Salinimicrobium catena TaxID=390640 RepID=UPI002FE4B430